MSFLGISISTPIMSASILAAPISPVAVTIAVSAVAVGTGVAISKAVK